jgi:uncharacterized protein (DUF779 family)
VRVTTTPEAEKVVARVAEQGRSDLVVVLGTGCCDSTAPFLYERYYPGSDVVEVGRVSDVPVFAHGWLADLYEGGELVLDVDQSVVNDSFSLESDLDCRLTLRTTTPANRGAG